MDELRARALVLLDHPPVEPRPLPELRDRAGVRRRRRRRGRQALAALATAALIAVVVASLTGGRTSSHPTIRVLVPPVTAPTTTAAPTETAGVTYLPPVAAFADTQNGWLVAGASCTNGRCANPIMRHTTDGGRTWPTWPSVPDVEQITLDSQTQRDLGGAVLLAFASRQDGWFSQGGQLWSTHDGGQSWQHLELGGVLAVAPMGETTWALQARCADASSTTLPAGQLSCPTVLLATPSALDDWAATDGATSGGGDLLVNDGSLWVLDTGSLWRTGTGQAATRVAPPCAGEPGLEPDRLLDLGVGRIGVLCAAGAVDGGTNTMAKVIVQSIDGGAHWTRFAVAPSTGWAGPSVGNGAGTALVVTDGQSLWRSTGGAWSKVFAPALPTGQIDQLTMIDPSDGFVVADDSHGGYGLWATHDGGRSWDPVLLR